MMSRENKFPGFLQCFLLAIDKGHPVFSSWMTTFINLTDHDRTLYLLRLDNDNTSQIIAKYGHLMFKKRKHFLSQKSNLLGN